VHSLAVTEVDTLWWTDLSISRAAGRTVTTACYYEPLLQLPRRPNPPVAEEGRCTVVMTSLATNWLNLIVCELVLSGNSELRKFWTAINRWMEKEQEDYRKQIACQ